MASHWHDARAASQNVGNHIGTRPCVRQSKLYRQYESGNTMKEMLGMGHLNWNVNKKQGAYEGAVYDHTIDGPSHGRRKVEKPLAAPPTQHVPQDHAPAPVKAVEQRRRQQPQQPPARFQRNQQVGPDRWQSRQAPITHALPQPNENLSEWNQSDHSPPMDHYKAEADRRAEERMLLKERNEAQQRLVEVQREQMRMYHKQKEDEINQKIERHRQTVGVAPSGPAGYEPTYVPGIRVVTQTGRTSNSSYGQYY